MSNKKFSDALTSRSPLARREAVEPVNMYGQPQADKSTKPQTSKEESGQGDKTTKPQNDKGASGQVGVTENPQVGNPTNGQNHKTTKPQVEKYTTHLRPETIKAVKRAALDQDRRDYEIVQAALDAYLGTK